MFNKIMYYFLKNRIPNRYNELAYTQSNPDVNMAIKNNVFKTGLEHYLLYGYKENRNIVETDNTLFEFGPLYHDYSLFGYKNTIIPGIYEKNQLSKQPIISAYIQYSIAKCKQYISDKVSFAELFCADAYYAMLANHFGAYEVVGIDNNKDNYSQNVERIAKKMNINNFSFLNIDVNNIDKLSSNFDIVANIGGLYHISNPEEIIKKSYFLANKYLIIQSVVSMANNDQNYFETPAPGWTWGCRFSKQSFESMIENLKYKIIDKHFNELEGNDRLEDRGSIYYLIEVKK